MAKHGWHALILLSALCPTGCKGDAPRSRPEAAPSVSTPACPPETAIEDLHAATFYFENGPPDEARSYVERARAATSTLSDPTLTRILDLLSRASRQSEKDPGSVAAGDLRLVFEETRVAFFEWSCFSEAMHARFHEALPPIQ